MKQPIKTHKDLAKEVAFTCQITQEEADTVISTFLDAMSRHLITGHRVTLTGFASLSPVQRPKTTGYDFQKKKRFKVKAKKSVSFRLSPVFKKKMNGVKK